MFVNGENQKYWEVGSGDGKNTKSVLIKKGYRNKLADNCSTVL